MARPIVDTTQLPIVKVTIPAARATPEEFDWFIDQMAAVLLRRTEFVVVIDFRVAAPFDVRQRNSIMRIERDHAAAVRLYQRGVIAIVTSPFLRALVNSLAWLLESHHPVRVVGTEEEAELLARTFLTASRGTAPPETTNGSRPQPTSAHP